MSKEPPDEPRSAAEGVCAFLASLGVGRTSVIHLVGKGALAPLLWLCRHGFDDVAMLSHGRATAEPADLLVLLNSETAALEQQAHALSQVRAGGVVIVRTRHRRNAACSGIGRLLARHGFRIERQQQSGQRDVVVARREATVVAAAR